MLIQPGTIVGGYRVEGILGRGGMSAVYSARHPELDRRVALKVLADDLSSSPDFVARFRREGRLQASLEHAHAVTVYEAGESEHGLYLAMRLIPGPTLALLLAERALDARRALALLAQVADALDAVHAAGLVHRDVKPQNVLIGEEDDAYLGDFGLVRVGGAAGVTETGKLMGTIAYLAPEVIRGGEWVPASDRYAFAAMAFECLTGGVVFPRGTEAAILYAHTSEPPPRISRRRRELPASLDDVFAKALAKEPNERPGSARELIDTISRCLEAAGATALGPPPAPIAALEAATAEPLVRVDAPPAPGRRWSLAMVAAAAVLGAAVALGAHALATRHASGPGVSVPAPLPGAGVLGSDLSQPGRTLDCRGRAPSPASPECTIAQVALPGRRLVVPEDGVIRRWAVRSARGELSLAVLRQRAGGAFQIARSENEFVESNGVFVFPTELAVERGDLVGLVAIEGSGIGARTNVDGATTERWIPHLGLNRPPDLAPGTGFDDEILLRVEYVPGAQQRLPRQMTGAAARQAPSGRVRVRRRRYRDGRRVDLGIVALGGRYVLDEVVDGHRTARTELPGFRSDGRIITFHATPEDGTDVISVYIEYSALDSTRIRTHYYEAHPGSFEFVN
jgi:hypothetical protein